MDRPRAPFIAAPWFALWWLAASCTAPAPTPGGDIRPGAADAGLSDVAYPSLPQLDEAIETEMRAAFVPGVAACIVESGAVSWCNGYGYANIEQQTLVGDDTPFLLASISKLVAGTAVMHGREAGVVDLDQSISAVLPFDVSHPSFPATEITTRMLMTHRSSVVDNWAVMGALYSDGDSPLALVEFMREYLTAAGQYYDAQQNFSNARPNTAFEYSNIGAALAAAVLEEAAKADFADYCRSSVFEPLGLRNTAWKLEDLDPALVAMPYRIGGGQYVPTGHYGFPDYPSGQLRASAEDLARILAMLIADGAIDGVRILEAESVLEMKRPQIVGDSSQALMWYYTELDGERLLGHGGAEQGVSTELQYRVSDGVGVVVLMNGEGRPATLPTIMRAMFAASDRL